MPTYSEAIDYGTDRSRRAQVIARRAARADAIPETLPAPYVTASTELGYATTVHGAQGVSADVMHSLATGAESRQQLYTMLTRGRHANHVYLQVVGDGDPNTVSASPA